MRTVTSELTPVAGQSPGSPTVIAAGQPFAGLYTIPSVYSLTSVAKNAQNDTEATLGAQFTINSVPIFQFMAFYQNTLEILPTFMTLSGRIHTNGELYLNSEVAGPLTIGDLPGINSNVQAIDKLQDTAAPPNDLDPLNLNCIGGASAVVPQATLNTYLGSLLRRVTPLQVPPVSTIARGAGGTFWDQADLRIVLRADQAAQVVNFGAANLCPVDAYFPAAPATSVALLQIEVQDQGGGQNVAKTRVTHR
jgi:hypothetical protein